MWWDLVVVMKYRVHGREQGTPDRAARSLRVEDFWTPPSSQRFGEINLDLFKGNPVEGTPESRWAIRTITHNIYIYIYINMYITYMCIYTYILIQNVINPTVFETCFRMFLYVLVLVQTFGQIHREVSRSGAPKIKHVRRKIKLRTTRSMPGGPS